MNKDDVLTQRQVAMQTEKKKQTVKRVALNDGLERDFIWCNAITNVQYFDESTGTMLCNVAELLRVFNSLRPD